MKTLKFLSLLAVIFLAVSCSRDDDNQPEPQLTATELLVSGRWYFETMGGMTLNACNKRSYYEFLPNGNFIGSSYSLDADDDCVQLLYVSGTYELLNDSEIQLATESASGTETEILTIIDISPNRLVLRNETAQTFELDKTEG